MKETMSVNGKIYYIVRFLGRGKGGYSYLAEREGKKYVLKQIHHEPCDYYTFRNKIEAEKNDYERLVKAGIRVPEMYEIDMQQERILKEYIDGPVISDLVESGKMRDDYLEQVEAMAEKAYKEGLNIDYYPTNFVVKDEILYYIDYECNLYDEKWNFENWGKQYWRKAAMRKIQKTALLGAGAVGAYFIWGLSEKLGNNFCVVAKENRKERLEQEGVVINNKHYNLNVKTPEEAGVQDLILVSCKSDALPGLLPDIKKMVGPNTLVLSLLNGVSSEEVIGNEIGMEHMAYAVMRIASVRNGNEITFSEEKTAGIYVGEKDKKKPTERLLALEEVLKDTGIRYNFVENIILDMWMKYASNVAQNLPQAILSVGFQAYKDSAHVHYIAEKLWKEVAAVANAKGIPLMDRFLLFRGVKPEARFSTLQDLDAKRHTEIEMLAGEMVKMGKEFGIETPYCGYTYHLIKALEEKNDGKFHEY